MDGPRIEAFWGANRFLSNFFATEIEAEGDYYPTLEHAFQAMKTSDLRLRTMIRMSPTPGIAKRAGRGLPPRSDWEDVKLDVMLQLLRKKFHKPELADLLLATGEAVLIEGNTWGDQYWGVSNGRGQNHLGRLLMQVRNELFAEIASQK